MSIRGGLHRAVERAAEVRATALQLFVKSARQWSHAALAPADVGSFRERLERHDLERHTLAHGSYLINLASPDAVVWERSVQAAAFELGRCEELRIPFYVLHPGAHRGAGEEAGLRQVVRALDRLLAPRRPARRTSSAPPVTLLLENTAGQGSCLGHRFEHLGWVIGQARAAERLGVCFDTCHALAANYDLRDAAGHRSTFGAFDRAVGLGRLRAFHMNDAKGAVGSRRDRHEHIGRGALGLGAFRRILNDRRFRGIPMILETPKQDDLAEDRENLRVLRSLLRRGSMD